MKTLSFGLILFLLFSPLGQSESQSHRQKRLSVFHLSETAIGEKLINEVGGRDAAFEAYNINEIQTEPKRRIADFRGEAAFNFTINSELLESSPIYFTWLLAYALNQYKVAKVLRKYHLSSLPEFIELTQWHYYTAMLYWSEAGFPNKEDLALDRSPRFSEKAISLMASTSFWTSKWRADSKRVSFFRATEEAHVQLGRPSIRIEDFLESATGPERAASLELLQNIKKDIPEF